MCFDLLYSSVWNKRNSKRNSDIIINVHDIFPRYLINGTIFEKMLLNIKYVFWSPLQLCLKQT